MKPTHFPLNRLSLCSRAYSSNVPQLIDLLQIYRNLVSLGKISYDEQQLRIVMKLRHLTQELEGYAPPSLTSGLLTRPSRVSSDTGKDSRPWWRAEIDDPSDEHTTSLVSYKGHSEEIASLTTPKGLLLTGSPGSGKTFLIDLWYSSLPTQYKIRKHYNELVLEIYRAVWEETQRRMSLNHSKPAVPQRTPWNRAVRDQWRHLIQTRSLPAIWARSQALRIDYEPSISFNIAKRLLLRHWLLVFDEVQLLDVSSAGLLADVLSWYWRMGGVCVGTSNKIPDDLYKNGVQRERLEPFVEALKLRCPVELLLTNVDWRQVKGKRGASNFWFSRSTPGRQAQFSAQFDISDFQQDSKQLFVFGRPLIVPWSAEHICMFSFSQLCDTALGSADYMTIASHFNTVIVTDIPVLKLSFKNQARRFISLIDALYESRCKLICLADAEPEDIFFPDAESGSSPSLQDDIDILTAESVGGRSIYRPNVASYDAPRMAEATEQIATPLNTLSIFSGKDEQFAFKRALSRLLEMTSEEYMNESQWSPLPRESRPWERASASSSHGSQQSRESLDHLTQDFAEEASYESSTRSPKQPKAPILAPDHIWGVREDWGKRSGEWGKGAKAYRGETGRQE